MAEFINKMLSRLTTRSLLLYRLPTRAFGLNTNFFTKNTETYTNDKYTKNDAETIINAVLPRLDSMNIKQLAETVNELSMLVVPIS